MVNVHTENESLDIPRVPRRVITGLDWMLLIATPIILYLGGVAATGGNMNGLILVGLAGLGIVTLRTVRLGRRNEPRVARWSGPGAIFVAVFAFVWSWSFFETQANEIAEQYTWPLVPVALYAVLVLAMFMTRRGR